MRNTAASHFLKTGSLTKWISYQGSLRPCNHDITPAMWPLRDPERPESCQILSSALWHCRFVLSQYGYMELHLPESSFLCSSGLELDKREVLYHLSYFPSLEIWGRGQEYFIHSFIISSSLRYSYNMINFTDKKKWDAYSPHPSSISWQAVDWV